MAAGDDDEAAAEADRVDERIDWAFWAIFTIFLILISGIHLNCKLRTQRLGHPAPLAPPPPVMVAIILLLCTYALLLYYLTFSLQTEPFQLSPGARLWINLAFALFGFGLAAFFCRRRDVDVWPVLLGFAICQHFFPIFNLLGCFSNFSSTDALRAVLIQAGALDTCLRAPSDFLVALAAVLCLALVLATSDFCYQNSEEELPETTSVV